MMRDDDFSMEEIGQILDLPASALMEVVHSQRLAGQSLEQEAIFKLLQTPEPESRMDVITVSEDEDCATASMAFVVEDPANKTKGLMVNGLCYANSPESGISGCASPVDCHQQQLQLQETVNQQQHPLFIDMNHSLLPESVVPTFLSTTTQPNIQPLTAPMLASAPTDLPGVTASPSFSHNLPMGSMGFSVPTTTDNMTSGSGVTNLEESEVYREVDELLTKNGLASIGDIDFNELLSIPDLLDVDPGKTPQHIAMHPRDSGAPFSVVVMKQDEADAQKRIRGDNNAFTQPQFDMGATNATRESSRPTSVIVGRSSQNTATVINKDGRHNNLTGAENVPRATAIGPSSSGTQQPGMGNKIYKLNPTPFAHGFDLANASLRQADKEIYTMDSASAGAANFPADMEAEGFGIQAGQTDISPGAPFANFGNGFYKIKSASPENVSGGASYNDGSPSLDHAAGRQFLAPQAGDGLPSAVTDNNDDIIHVDIPTPASSVINVARGSRLASSPRSTARSNSANSSEPDLIEIKKENDDDLSCHVCGEKAGKHSYYGGQVCASCRAFFRRSVQSKYYELFACKRGKNCEITVKNRKNCQFCRFKKCISAGMKVTWVLSDEERNRRFNKFNKVSLKSAGNPIERYSPAGKRGNSIAELYMTFTQEESMKLVEIQSKFAQYKDNWFLNLLSTDKDAGRMLIEYAFDTDAVNHSFMLQAMQFSFQVYFAKTLVSQLQEADNLSSIDKNLIFSGDSPKIAHTFKVFSCFAGNEDRKQPNDLFSGRDNFYKLNNEEDILDCDKVDTKEEPSDGDIAKTCKEEQCGLSRQIQEVTYNDDYMERLGLREKFAQLEISHKKPRLPCYRDMFPHNWAPEQVEERHLELKKKIIEWPRDDNNLADCNLVFLMTIILIFNPDFCNIKNRDKVESVQLKFILLLQRYLRSRMSSSRANLKFLEAMLMISYVKELYDITTQQHLASRA